MVIMLISRRRLRIHLLDNAIADGAVPTIRSWSLGTRFGYKGKIDPFHVACEGLGGVDLGVDLDSNSRSRPG
jgi:hypothetical protein